MKAEIQQHQSTTAVMEKHKHHTKTANMATTTAKRVTDKKSNTETNSNVTLIDQTSEGS